VEKDELKQKIMEDEDFIKAPKYANSLNRFLAKNERKLDSAAIGRLLLITEEEVDQLYEQSVIQLRKGMTEDEDRDL